MNRMCLLKINTREIFCGNYHLTSQWIEPQLDLYLKWLKKIGYDYN
jgi:hypothetical protein